MAGGCGDSDKDGDVDDDPTHVTIADGEVRGSIVGTDHQARAFLGIPYAKPPVGDLRWKAPQKPDPWTTPRDATTFSKRCAQLANETLGNAASNDEDCLYLNVWTPSPVPQAALPVMIWIHGGGNVNGSVSEPVPFSPGPATYFYTGEFLAENHGVVVVSMNYRLGLFGFFAHPDLTTEGSSGNQGLFDQRLAMQWVRDNIAKFGGDPDNVTIFGESAGALDVCLHVASAGSSGLFLFHRAISQSGGCTTLQRTKTLGEMAATTFATDVGCPSPGALACLRGKSAAELMTSADVAAGRGFGPDVDGQFLTDQPRTLFDAKNIAKVPYMLGSNTDEGTLFTLDKLITTEAEYMAKLTATFGAVAADIAIVYKVTDFDGRKPNPAHAAWARVFGDSRLTCSTYDSAARAAAAGSTVYMYNFDIPAPVEIPGFYLGATHGSELTSVFGTSPAFALDAPAKAASDLIQRYWTNFAKSGDPNGGGADLAWPKQAAGENVRINLALQPTIVNDFRKAECQFWLAGYTTQF